MKKKHPTIFVFQGSIHQYDDGSMLELHTQVTTEEWENITEETIKYKIFLDCLKEIAIPKLEETWDKEDEWFREELNIALSRIKNIDPLMFAKFNQETIKNNYSAGIEKSSDKMVKFIGDVRKERKEFLEAQLNEQLEDQEAATKVSDL